MRVAVPKISRLGAGPLVLVLSLVGLCGVLFWVLHERGFEEKLAGAPRDAEAAAGEIGDRLDAAVDHLNLLAEDLKSGAMDRARFETLAAVFLRNHAEVVSIAWVDAGRRYQWVAPPAGNEALVGLPVSERDEESALAAAERAMAPAFTEPYASGAASGARKLAVFAPVFKGARYLGAFRCQFSLEGILNHTLPAWLASRYEVDLVTRDGIVAAKSGRDAKTDPNLGATRALDATGGALGLRLQRYAEGIDWEVVVFGALIAGLAAGVALAVVELSRDNKRRARLAVEMEAARDMAESASQAKTEFLANVSHEIRTPIGAIIGYAEMQARAPLAPPELVESAVAIKRNGEHLLVLVNELLDLSKVEAGLLEVDPRPVPLAGIVREALATIRPLAAAKRLSLTYTALTPVPRSVRTDPLRLRQILVNVLGNAVKFTGHGGVELTVALRQRAGGGDELVFAVHDSGIGIGPDQRARLFKPFVQADSRVARRYGGTGLGLALSKRLAALLGGDLVLVDSAPGEGATFDISLDPGPLAAADLSAALEAAPETARPAARPAPAARARLTGVAVLLIEDVEDNQVILRELLESEGAAVDCARDGQDGLERLAQGAIPDVVLMDIQMPGMDGYQATQAIRRRGFTRPIIALTAHAMRGERERCLGAGCDDYLAKPVDAALLFATVARHAAGAPLVSRLVADPRVAQVLPGFLGRLPARLDDLRAAAALGDAKRIAQLAHSLKGTAGNYGFPELARAAAELERAARSEEDKDALPLYIDGLGNLIHRVQRGHAPPAQGEMPG